MLTLEEYIDFLYQQTSITFDGDKNSYEVQKYKDTPIVFFNKKNIVFKLLLENEFIAVKCDYLRNIDQDKPYHKKEIDSIDLIEENKIGFLTIHKKNGSIIKQKVYMSKWYDEESSFLGNNYVSYSKELHNEEQKKLYLKNRKRVKISVFISLIAFICILTGFKLNRNEIALINPVDYRQLIVDDSIRSLKISTNNHNALVENTDDKIVKKKKEIISNNISNLENKNKDTNTLEKIDSKIDLNKIKDNKKELVAENLNKVNNEKKKTKKQQSVIKVINTKSTVTFRSTDF